MIDEETSSRRTDEAAAWFARLNNSKISNTDLSAFWAWRKDPLNRAAYDEVSRISATAAELRGDPEIHAAVRQALTRKAGSRPGQAGAPRTGRGLMLAGGALAAGAALVAILALAQGGQRYDTGVGQQLTVDLADGSKARLNTDTRLRVRFARGERRLYLERGQAFFEVAHDPLRPFIVDAGRASVRAVGTRFDVRRSQDDVEITLTQGRVQVTPRGAASDATGASWALVPGQQIRVDRDPAKARPAPVDVETATAWTTGRLLFRDVPLGQAVAEVNRYSRKKVVLGPGAPGGAKINGAFETGDTDGFAAGAAASLDLSLVRKSDAVLELRAHGAPAA